MSNAIVLAAGGVLWRGAPLTPEVALVHRPRYDDWSVPKGKAKSGEHLLVTALREMSEETGHVVRVGPRLTTVRYRVTSGGRPATKVVTYWSMRCAGGLFNPNREVDRIEWLPVEAARRHVTSATDRVVLDAFRHARRDTEALLLVRPGPTTVAARRLKAQHGAERLNRSGRDQAAALVPVLEGLGVTDLRSADLPACVDMLAPFAAATGLTVRREPALNRAEFTGKEQEIADRLLHDASASEAVAVCGQQRVITGLLAALGRRSVVRPPHETAVKKGGWWLLHHRDGTISSYERHEPAA
jgi:8-oxo-dGTP pyrophosphatase MutT (NUDIX family)